MKKLLVLILVPLLALSFGACNSGKGTSEPPANATYQYDEDSHWKGKNGEESEVGYHDYEIIGTPADYDHAGELTYTCKICGYSFIENEEQLAHEYESALTPVEGDEEHYHYRKCIDIGFEDLYADKHEHDFETVEVKSSFTEYGYELHRCKDCGYSYKDNYDNMLMTHTYDAKFSFDDEYHWSVCVDPGYENLKSDENKHTFESDYVMVGDTYYIHRYCRRCDYSYDYDFYSPSSLTYESEWSFDRGEHWHKCITDGYEDCKLLQENHKWGDWTIVKEPSEFTDGSRTRVCDTCGYEEKQVLGSIASGNVESLTLKYFAQREGYYITGYKGTPTSISIPKYAYEKPILGIDDNAFSGCISLRTITFANDSLIENFGKNAFSGCTLEEINAIPKSLETIDDNCFINCKNLTSFTIPEKVTFIGESAFSGCSKLETVNMNATALSMSGSKGKPIFKNLESFTTLNIANNVKGIPSYFCYFATKLTSVNFEDIAESSLTSIGSYAFSNTEINSFTIPKNVNTVKKAAFAKCMSLASINYYAENCSNWDIPFRETSSGAAKLPDEVSIFIGNTVKMLPTRFLYKINKVKSITFENDSKLVSIFSKAFYLLNNVESLIIPDSVKTINERALAYMKGLTSITIGKGITAFPEYMMEKNMALKEINYTGTCSQWENIKKEKKWNYFVGTTIVHCTDGDVKLTKR